MDMVSETSQRDAVANAAPGAPPKVPLALVLGVTGHRPDLLDGRTRADRAAAGGDVRRDRCAGHAHGDGACAVVRGRPRRGFISSRRWPRAPTRSRPASRSPSASRSAQCCPSRAATMSRTLPRGRRATPFTRLSAKAQSVLELPGERDAPLGRLCHGRARDGRALRHAGRNLGRRAAARTRRHWRSRRNRLARRDRRSSTCRSTRPRRCACCGAGSIPTSARRARMPTPPPCRTASKRWRRARLRSCCPRPTFASAASSSIIIASASGGLNLRLEYPLLLALTGRRPHRPHQRPRRRRCTEALESEWQAFRDACGEGHGVATAIDPLQRAYCWSDQLARHFAQTYRSGHIFNFLVGAAAVLVALAGLVLPRGKAGARRGRAGDDRRGDRQYVWSGCGKAGTAAGSIIASWPSGCGRCAASSCSASRRRAADPHARLDERRWTEWYAAGMWRAMGNPTGMIGDPARLAAALTEHELVPQVAYHRRAAHQAESLDHRLHLIGLALVFGDGDRLPGPDRSAISSRPNG